MTLKLAFPCDFWTEPIHIGDYSLEGRTMGRSEQEVEQRAIKLHSIASSESALKELLSAGFKVHSKLIVVGKSFLA
jgi:hypothetical protein